MENINDPNLQNIIPFHYGVSSGAMSASGSSTQTLTFDQSSDFEWIQTFASSSLDTDTDTMPNNFTVRITNNSTGRLLSNIQLPQRIIASPSNDGYIHRRSIIIPAGSVLQYEFVNLDAGNANTVTLVFAGFKLF